MKISIIIPVYREEKTISPLLDSLLDTPDQSDTEIIVVDGARDSGTLNVITHDNVRKISSPPGRGLQLNAGAKAATGSVFLFLHADTTLPPQATRLIQLALAQNHIAGGAFALRYAQNHPGLALIARAANMRTRRTRVPYGDQAIFIRKEVFEALGGFAPIPIMEDVEFMTRLRRAGHAIRLLEIPVRTSGRRQLGEGLVLCTARNLGLRLLYHLGVPARCLTAWYRRPGE